MSRIRLFMSVGWMQNPLVVPFQFLSKGQRAVKM